MRLRTHIGLAVGMTALLGCASTSPKSAFEDVARDVKSRTGHDLRSSFDAEDDPKVARAVDELLARDLTADAAVQVALLASPRLRARLEELAIAQADLVQAGLLKNPVFGVGQTAWEMDHIDPNLFANVEQDFLDLVTLPLRKRVAETELEVVKLELADHVLELAAHVRETFYAAQSAEQVVAMRRVVNETASAAAELARAQHAAGNINDLDLGSELALAAQNSLDLARAQNEAAVTRENLNKLMGAWGARTRWRTNAHLPDLPDAEPSLERLESAAVAGRPDLAAARRNVQAVSFSLGLAKTTRWTGVVNVALEAGRLRSTRNVRFGPSVSLEIPLFDQRQAQIARLEALARQNKQMLEQLAVDVRADVRSAVARVQTTRTVTEQYGKLLVPLRRDIVRASQEQYDAMLIGVYQLILAKQNELDTYRQYIEALRDYWIARSDLERAVGRRL